MNERYGQWLMAEEVDSRRRKLGDPWIVKLKGLSCPLKTTLIELIWLVGEKRVDKASADHYVVSYGQ